MKNVCVKKSRAAQSIPKVIFGKETWWNTSYTDRQHAAALTPESALDSCLLLLPVIPLLPSVSLSGLINLLPPSLSPLFLSSHPCLPSLLLFPSLHVSLPSLFTSSSSSSFCLPPTVISCVLLTNRLEVVRSWLTYFPERRHTYHLISITPRQTRVQQMLRESY